MDARTPGGVGWTPLQKFWIKHAKQCEGVSGGMLKEYALKFAVMRPPHDLTEVPPCTRPIDFRKGLVSLATLVEGNLDWEPVFWPAFCVYQPAAQQGEDSLLGA
ncbi:MAG: hypothetical protein HQL89_09390 [Magnetococcales bacterium]|nr:hypothetical protein [Magnetococcales bacterium]